MERSEVQDVIHMVGGEGESSYAANSQAQRMVLSKTSTIIQKNIADVYYKIEPKCFTIADLGCSTGTNTLHVVSMIINTICSLCQKLCRKPPEIHVMLNDLPNNDFNTLFKCVPSFLHKLNNNKVDGFQQHLFIAGVPGSFHGRLFPSQTLHFAHSSYCLHYLSRIPSGIQNTKGNVYISKSTHSTVVEAYIIQFRKDYKSFLISRSQEIVPGGCMVLTLIGRNSSNPIDKESYQLLELLAQSLHNMVSQGILKQDIVDSFNFPVYFPSREELQNIIQEEGSFNLNLLETFNTNWDPSIENSFDAIGSGRNVSNSIRAVLQCFIIKHFGEEIIEDLFQNYAVLLGEYLAKEKGYYVNHVMCLIKKSLEMTPEGDLSVTNKES